MPVVSSVSSSRPSEPERWHVRREPSRGGVGEWEDALAATHVAFDIRFTSQTPDRFHGNVVRRRFGDLMLVDCACAPFAGHRSTAVMGDAGESLIGFQLVRSGAERVRHKAAELMVTPGETILWDGSQPVDVEVVEPFVKRTLLFPRDRVIAVCPRLADTGAFTALRDSTGARLLARYVDALATELPWFDAGTGAAAADAALELLRAAVEPGMPESRAARRDALRADVRRYIRLNLQDLTLSPESIARAHAISLRALHALFEDSGESVAALVRQSRLARCLEDLRQPTAGSVTEIAFRWGFSDAAYFSHVFKRAYGVTPSEIRRAALAGDAAAARIGKDSRADSMA